MSARSAAAPTARQLAAFRLRCQGLRMHQVAAILGVSQATAGLLATAAAGRLIVAKPTPENAADQALAFRHFPKIARCHARALGVDA